jgi:2-keto-4-pentenoate hydratase
MTEKLALQFWTARTTGTSLPADFENAPDTEEAAYRIQGQTAAIANLPMVGWKIGATSEALYPVLGIDKPFIGPLYDAFTYASGDTVPVLPGHSLETEITVKLRNDLPARAEPYSRDDIAQSIASIFPSFEVVGVRFEGGFAGAGLKLIADGGANVATVLGPEITDWSGCNLADIAVSLSLDGQPAIEGNTSALLWDHIFDAVAWVIQQPPLKERGLRAGDILMTGTCTGITPLAGVREAVLTFGGIGSVTARFAEFLK